MADELETLYVGLEVETDKFKSGLDSADNIAKGWAGKLGGAVGGLVQGAIIGASAAVVAGVLTIGTAAFDVSMQVDSAAADIAASLRVPTEEAEAFADVARRVYGNNFADSVTDAAEGVKQIALQMGLAADDPSLQRITEHAFRLRDAFGTEVPEGVNAAKTLMDNFGLTADEAFNMIAAGYQRGLDSSDDFLETIGEYSTQFANGGADVGQFFSLLDSGLQGGMLGTDKAADAFKEFRLRIQDGSDATSEALDALEGTIDSGILRGLQDGSVSAADAFELVIEGLNKIEDPTLRMQTGAALLGTQFEDLGDSAAGALTLTNDWAAGSKGAIDSLDKKYDTFGSAVEAIWRRLIVGVSPYTDKLLELVNDAMPAVMGAFDAFDAKVGPTMDAISGSIGRAVDFVTGLFDRFKQSADSDVVGPLQYWQQWAATNLPMVQALFDRVLGAIQGFWDTNGASIMRIVDNTFGTAWTIIDTVMRNIGDLITLALQIMTGDFAGAEQTLLGIINRTWETIKTVIGNQLDSIKTAILLIDWGQMGRNIIEGIANGIANAAGTIARAAEDAARRAYEAAKSWLGIHSPSTRFEGLGEDSGEGYEVGWQNSMARVSGQINNSLAGMMGNLSSPQPTMATAPAGPTWNINIYLQGSATHEDGRRVAQGFSDEMRAQGLA